MLTRKEDIQRWLEETPVIDRFQDSKQKEAFLELVGHEGFRVFLGLMLGLQQTFMRQLASPALPINGAEGAARASVLQGKIQAIDLERQSVLDLVCPNEGA